MIVAAQAEMGWSMTHDKGDDGYCREDLIVAVEPYSEESAHGCHTSARGK